jgi:lipoate-protein ligase A
MLRTIDTGLRGARWNVAVTAALAELHERGEIPDTLRLHRYPACVLLGRSQPLAVGQRAVCARRGAEIARRMTGGGAVAMGPGALAWDLVLMRGAGWTLEGVAARLGRALGAAIGSFGLAASYRPPGSLMVGNGKVAGMSGLFEGRTLLWQGSLLVDADVTGMAELLCLPALPVTTLAARGVRLSMAEVAAAVAAAIAAALGVAAQPAGLGAAERALAARLLAEEVGTDSFVMGDAA